MREARDIDQHDVQGLIDDNRELIAQVNELRMLLSRCWGLVPDGEFLDVDAGVTVKHGMSKYQCWPKNFEAVRR